MKLADLNGNGRLDIIIGQTRAEPYYRGRQLQVLINQRGITQPFCLQQPDEKSTKEYRLDLPVFVLRNILSISGRLN